MSIVIGSGMQGLSLLLLVRCECEKWSDGRKETDLASTGVGVKPRLRESAVGKPPYLGECQNRSNDGWEK